jgi:cytochrome c biogenesis protein CcdA
MGIWAWLILFGWSAALATAAQYTLFRNEAKPNDYDWVYIAGGALLGAFTAHVWYPIAGLPTVDGLNIVQALAGGVVGGVVVELVYRLFLRRREALPERTA